MGNSLSLSGSKEITGEQLKLSSKEISIMSSELFRFMYSSWKPKDVWDIAENPDKYVIAISDMITTQFHVLGYKTRDKRMGEIYFRKWDDLEPPMGSESEMVSANSRNDRSLADIRDEVVSRRLKREISDRKRTRRTRAQSGYAIQKQNAEIIAFYFVRIFQILGAMLLVVKDIELPAYNKDTGEPTGIIAANQTRNFASGLYPSQLGVSGFRASSVSLNDRKKLEYAEAALRAEMEKRNSRQSKEIQTQEGGGRQFDISMPLGPYEFLRYYLRTIDENDKLDFNTNGIKLPDGNNIYMLDKSRLLFFRYTYPKDADVINLVNGVTQEFGLPVKETGRSSVDIKFIKVKVDKIWFNTKDGQRGIHEVKGYVAPSKRKLDKEDIFPTDIVITYERSGGERTSSSITLKRDEIKGSVDNGIPYYIITADNNILDTLKGKYDQREEFSKFLEEITLFYLVRMNNNIRVITLKDKVDIGDNSEKINHKDEVQKSKITKPSNKALADTFSAIEPGGGYRPHCVARALQLLDPASINNFPTGSATSNICKTSLGKATSKTSLSEYIPTKSLGQLYGKVNPTDYANSMKVLSAFVQKGSTGSPVSLDDASKFPGEKDDLQVAIQRLMKAFDPNNKEPMYSFADIKSDIPLACGTTGKEKELKVDRNSQVFRDMKSSSQQLLAYHLKSIVEISKFLKKIFNISQRGDGSWQVEGPKVELLFAGYDTLNNLTNQARAILIDYYAGCEEIYQRGIGKWAETRKGASDETKGKEPVLGAILSSPVVAEPVARPTRNAGV